VSAFPKSTAGQWLLTGAPASVSAAQLRDLHVTVSTLQDSNEVSAESNRAKQAGCQKLCRRRLSWVQAGLRSMLISLGSMLHRTT